MGGNLIQGAWCASPGRSEVWRSTPDSSGASRPASRSMPRSAAAREAPARSVGRSGGSSTSVSRRVAMSLKRRSSSRWSVSAARTLGRLLSQGAVERGLQRAVSLEEVGRALLADPLRAGDAVGGIPAQRHEVGHELGRNAVAALHLGRVYDLRAATARYARTGSSPGRPRIGTCPGHRSSPAWCRPPRTRAWRRSPEDRPPRGGRSPQRSSRRPRRSRGRPRTGGDSLSGTSGRSAGSPRTAPGGSPRRRGRSRGPPPAARAHRPRAGSGWPCREAR